MAQGAEALEGAPRVAASRARLGRLEIALFAESALCFLVCWIYYPLAQGNLGDFVGALSHRDAGPHFWDGRGVGYGPIFALYDLLLRPFHDADALHLMFAANLVYLGVAFFLLLEVILPRPRTTRELAWALFVWINFYPLAQALRQNVIEITVLLFLAAAYFSFSSKRDFLAGLSLGAAICAKPIPIVLLGYLAWRRRWRALAGAATAIGALGATVLFLKGITLQSVLDDYAHTAEVAHLVRNQFFNNQALSGFIYRVFSVFDFSTELAMAYPQVLHPDAARAVSVLISLVLVAACAVVFIRRAGFWPRPGDPSIERLETQMVLLVVLLANAYIHTHYFALIVPLYIEALRLELLEKERRVLWIGFGLLGFLMPLRLLDPLVHRWGPFSALDLWKLYSLPLFGALLTLAVMFRAHGRASRSESGGRVRP